MAIRKSSISGGSGGNGFSLLVGSSGNTTFTFDTDQPAGAYSVSSELSDTTFDIYLVTSGNESAGYTNSGALDAAAAFNRIVLYGGTENDILNFEFKTYTSPATKGDVADGAAPFLTSATPTTLASADDTTTVTGGNFAADVGISFIGQDTIVVPAKSVVRSSSTELIVTRPDAFPVAQEPFTMTATNAGITNPSVVVNKLTDYFDAGSGLVWVTTSPLADFVTDSAYSDTLEATDVDGGAITYAVTTGSLPTGLSLNYATGVISGTPTGSADETFTVTATDAGGNSSPREFLLPKLLLEVDYLVVAGGGGGGLSTAGGGGAGGYRTSAGTSGGGASAESSLSLVVSTNYTVTVGGGGAASTSIGAEGVNGVASTIATITSDGGGGGGSASVGYRDGLTGGSGGGGGGLGTGGAPSSNQGYAGGTSADLPAGAGGGGAGAVGAANVSYTVGGAGGAGQASSITGSSITRAGGGGAGTDYSGVAYAAGGSGGGGQGAIRSGTAGQAGTINTGSGGGGGSNNVGAGAGGSGVVIIKYPDAYTITVGAGLTYDPPITDGAFKITVLKSGTDNISFA